MLDARAQNFDHDITAIKQLRGVNLRHRSRGKGVGIEFSKTLVKRLAEGRLDSLDCLLCRKGGNLILQQREFICDVMRQKIPACGEQLAKFDEDRPQIFQSPAKPLPARRRRGYR